jgi:CDP-diacylglycerol--glycerol-3-phosphate 3-phosphatidyltransferase
MTELNHRDGIVVPRDGAPPAGAPVRELAHSGVTGNAVSVWNLANGLTLLRVVLVPFFALALCHRGGHTDSWRVLAWGFFAVASVTDRLDGEVARRRGLVTEFGKLADPIADKALIGTALIGLSIQNLVPWWVTAVILVREVAVTVLRFWVIRQGVIAASRGGKLKTLIQSVAIGLVVLPLPGVWHDVANALLGVAVVLTVVTGLDYLLSANLGQRRS